MADRVAFLEDYDLSFAAELVAGCDVWVNVPRPPEEASGTSGMKAALNGSLNLSVLDGWWAEAYDGTNGWAIDGEVDPDREAQDASRRRPVRPARGAGDPDVPRTERRGSPSPVVGDGASEPADERPSLLGYPHGAGVRHADLPRQPLTFVGSADEDLRAGMTAAPALTQLRPWPPGRCAPPPT